MTAPALVKSADLALINSQIECGKVGYIYFITNPEARTVKIGFATDVHRRLESIQTGNHVQLMLHSGFKSAPYVERIIHRVLAPYRIFNEWFRHDDEVEQLIVCFEDIDLDLGGDNPLLTEADIVKAFSDWANSFGRGASAAACGNNVDRSP